MHVDPQLFALACTFVDDTIDEIDAGIAPSDRREFYNRAAQAMQQAIEAECQEIEHELKPQKER
jgi:hypothetical protein